jgi:hypothetical protein
MFTTSRTIEHAKQSKKPAAPRPAAATPTEAPFKCKLPSVRPFRHLTSVFSLSEKMPPDGYVHLLSCFVRHRDLSNGFRGTSPPIASAPTTKTVRLPAKATTSTAPTRCPRISILLIRTPMGRDDIQKRGRNRCQHTYVHIYIFATF